MLDLIGLLGLVAFVAASLVVGTRILLLARLTRGMPEILVGLSLILAGGVGTGLAVIPALWTAIDVDSAYWIYQVSSIANHLGFALLFFFVWRVFRPGTKWAAVLFSGCVLLLAMGGVGISLTLNVGESISLPEGAAQNWLLVSLGARLVGYVWATIESFSYYAKLKRRIKLGLSDPLTASRFYYWGVCTSAVVCIWLILAAQQVLEVVKSHQSLSHLASALLGFVVAGSLWLAFFPRTRSTERTASPERSAGASRLG